MGVAGIRRVFISYAHESREHMEAVRNLWIFLRQCGADARTDLVAAQRRQDWSLWMGDEIRNADYVLVVASAAYRDRAEGRSGFQDGQGVQWEARLIRDSFYADQRAGLDRFVPVVLPGQSIAGVPDFLAPTTTTVYEVSSFSLEGADSLLRLLTDQPLEVEPPLGRTPVLGARDHALMFDRVGLRQMVESNHVDRRDREPVGPFRSVLEFSDLTQFISEEPLGRGGSASVHDMPGLRLDDVLHPLVYKRYHDFAPIPDVEELAVRRSVLSSHLQIRLDEIVAWPVRAVMCDGKIVGAILPRLPESFFDNLGRADGQIRKSVREVQNLMIDNDRLRLIGRQSVNHEERLRLCRDFARVVSFLHDEMRVIIGDISARSAVYRLDAKPMILFLGCDSVHPLGSTAEARQVDAPDWVAPEGRPLSLGTDLYKLGLFILRSLTPGRGSSVNSDPDAARVALDITGIRMLRRALGTDARMRPAASAWEKYFDAVI